MEEKLYNKIAVTCQQLSNRFYTYSLRYGGIKGYYREYDIEVMNHRSEQMDLFTQIQDVKYRDFLSDKHLSKHHYGQDYLSSTCVNITDKTIGIHAELSSILFYYLASIFKEQIIKLNEIINSDEFSNTFKGIVSKEEHLTSYLLGYHDEITIFLSERIENYSMLFHLLHQTSSIFLVDTRKMNIKTSQLNQILENLDTIYDFDDIEIK
ncbi:hypothetical protein [uncultured Zobellia sp.]|uniref:hypothetical protein n=1 Tax=uncultured Zobellia sp. TaxID=255433 RepID=UPI00259874EB|nr:hypothetical protein [uncultured Zobellia sp.]